jgi:hypothetical protein
MTSSRRKIACSFEEPPESPEMPGFVVSKIAMKMWATYQGRTIFDCEMP